MFPVAYIVNLYVNTGERRFGGWPALARACFAKLCTLDNPPLTRNVTAGRERSRNSRIFSLSSANLPTQIPEIEPEPEARCRTRIPPDISARHRGSWMPSTNASSLGLSPVEETPAEAHHRKRTSWHMLSRPEPSFTVPPRPEPTSAPGHGQVEELSSSRQQLRDWLLSSYIIEVGDLASTVQRTEVNAPRKSRDLRFRYPSARRNSIRS